MKEDSLNRFLWEVWMSALRGEGLALFPWPNWVRFGKGQVKEHPKLTRMYKNINGCEWIERDVRQGRSKCNKADCLEL